MKHFLSARPLCLACLFFLVLLFLLDKSVYPLAAKRPLSPAREAALLEEKSLRAAGVVKECRETAQGMTVLLQDAQTVLEGETLSLHGLRVFLSEQAALLPGDSVLCAGRLSPIEGPTNPGEFDSALFYACEHTYYDLKKAVLVSVLEGSPSPRRSLFRLRGRFQEIFSLCADSDAPLFDALLLGDKSLLSEETRAKYQLSGILHLLAISGLHVSLMGMGVGLLLQGLGVGLFPRSALGLLFVLGFGILTGSSVSTLRAVTAYVMATGAKAAGRSSDPPTTLSLTAALLVFEAPAYLYSASFLLSFGAVLSLVFLAPAFLAPLGRVLPKNRALAWLFTSLAGSCLTSLGTLPIVLHFYGEVSLAGCFLNLVVLPTAGLVLACGAGALLLGLLPGGLFLARFLLYPARALLWLYDTLCTGAVRLPFCTLVGGQSHPLCIVLFYGLLLLGIRILKRGIKRESKIGRESSAAGVNKTGRKSSAAGENGKKGTKELPGKRECRQRLLLFSLLALLASALVTVHPRRGLTITCLDIGQGDALVIQTPGGRNYLMDGGSTSRSKVGTYVLLPFLKSQGISRLDGLFLSHTDEDHYNGMMELLTACRDHLTSLTVGTLYLPDWESPPPVWEELSALALEAGGKVQVLGRGDVLLSGEVSFTALAPFPGATGEDPNEDGLVLLVRYRDFQGLLTGDIGFPTEERLLPDLSHADYLKVGHHGSGGSSGEEFLRRLSPEAGVISCARVNRYGHPSPEAVERLEEAGCSLSYTMEGGAISCFTDGKSLRMRSFVKKQD